jgi:hypothetical protein
MIAPLHPKPIWGKWNHFMNFFLASATPCLKSSEMIIISKDSFKSFARQTQIVCLGNFQTFFNDFCTAFVCKYEL